MSYIKLIKILSLILYLAYSFADASENMPSNKELYSLPTGCDFFSIGNNDSIEFDCSPQLTDKFFSEFEGLLINTPDIISWPKGKEVSEYQGYPNGNNDSPLKFMVAGLANVPDSTIKFNGDIANQILIIAVNQETAEIYSGKMIEMSASDLDLDIPTNTQESNHDFTRKHYFNIDLINNAGLPITNATYTVYATLGKYKSNVRVVTTKIVN